MNFNSTSTFQLPPPGAHAATLFKIIDIGTQKGEYQGKPTERRQLIFTWELPFETMEDGQPYIISKFYTMSLGEKANLTADLTSWFGKSPDPSTFDPKDLLGKSCQVIVTEKEGTGKRGVNAVAPLPKGTAVPKETHNSIAFLDLDNFDEGVFESLSDRLKEMISKSPEYIAAITSTSDTPAVEEDDTIPF